MEKRTKPLLDELSKFSADLINLTRAKLLEIQHLKAEGKPVPLVERFRNALLAHSKQVIETGYIFDPQIFVAAIKIFQTNVGRFGGWYSDKSNLFWIHGFGLLQDLAAACDLQVIKSGIYFVVQENKAVDRNFNFSRGRPANISGLGSIFYLDIVARYASVAREQGALPRDGNILTRTRFFQYLGQAKESARQNLCSESNREPTQSLSAR